MTGFQSILSPQGVEARLDLPTKKSVFAHLTQLGAQASGLDAAAVSEGLWLRERLGPTGFGGGTAIPHARLEGLGAFHMAVVTLANPVEYDAVDGAPVDLFVLLLSPTDGGARHLKLLAQISRLLRTAEATAKLRGARTGDALYSLLVPPDARDAA